MPTIITRPPLLQQGLEDIIHENFFKAFHVFGGDPTKLDPDKLASVMKRLQGRAKSLARHRTLSKDEPLLDYASKAQANFNWLSTEHNISRPLFCGYLLKAPDVLMISKPETIRSNFEGIVEFLSQYENKERVAKKLLSSPKVWSHNPENMKRDFQTNLSWMSEHGITETEWGKALANNPTLLERDPETLKDHYERICTSLTSRGLSKEQWKETFLKYCNTIHLDPERVETNISGTVSGLNHLGVTNTVWATICVKDPCIMNWPPATNVENFNKNIAWSSAYDITPVELLEEFKNFPHFFHRNPASLQTNYEMMRITCAMPEYKCLKPRQRSKESKPKNPALMRFSTLSFGEDNWLIRIAMAELVGKKKEVYSTLSRPRGTVERVFVKTLGHDPNQKEIHVSLDARQLAITNDIVGEHLKKEIHKHATALRRAWRKNLAMTEDKRKPITTNVLGILLPFGRATKLSEAEKQALLERSILAGLLKSYKFVAAKPEPTQG